MIGIFAAYGFTGSLIAAELSGTGYPIRLIGRSPEKLKALAATIRGNPQLVEADVTDPAAVARALDGLKVLINCAGPFTDLGEPVLREATNRGVNYLDTTGEQSFIRLALNQYGPIAAEKGSAVIPACAFEYALGDAAAAMAAEPFGECDAITLTYNIAGFGSSRGTKKSVLRVMGLTGFTRQGGEPTEIPRSAASQVFDLPGVGKRRGYLFSGGEVFMAPLHVSTRDLSTFMVFPGPRPVVRIFNSLLPALIRSPLGSLASKLVDRGAFGPNEVQRQATEFVILCEARRNRGSRRVVVKGRDPYGLTARIAARAAQLIETGKVENTGGLSPSMLAGHEEIVRVTSAEGVKWEVTDLPVPDARDL
ncbi:MAG: saccharopine dehydrogenase family protein, partial [Blastocatellia bacterium]